jgi:hypothetical protein
MSLAFAAREFGQKVESGVDIVNRIVEVRRESDHRSSR